MHVNYISLDRELLRSDSPPSKKAPLRPQSRANSNDKGWSHSNYSRARETIVSSLLFGVDERVQQRDAGGRE
jgi:hypothetical protein